MKQINFRTEPVAIIVAITTLIEAIVAMLPLFGISLSPEQQSAIMAAVVAIGGVVSALWARSIVYAPATVARLTTDPFEGEGLE